MLLPPKKAYAHEFMGIFHYFRNEKQFSKIHTHTVSKWGAGGGWKNVLQGMHGCNHCQLLNPEKGFSTLELWERLMG